MPGTIIDGERIGYLYGRGIHCGLRRIRTYNGRVGERKHTGWRTNGGGNVECGEGSIMVGLRKAVSSSTRRLIAGGG